MSGPFNPSLVDPRILQALSMPNSPQAQAQLAKPKMSIWDKMQNAVLPTPEGMGGLLGEGDIKSARGQGLLGFGASLLADSGWSTQPTGFGQALGRGIQAAQGAYNGAIDQQMNRVGAKQQLDVNKLKIAGMQQEQASAGALQASRKALIAKHGQPTSNDPNAMAQWIDGVLPDLMAAGDEEMVARLSEIRKSLGGQSAAQPEKIDLGGKVILRDPKTGAIVGEYEKTAAPRDSGAGQEQRAALQMQRDFQREQQIGDDFNKDTTPMRQVAAKIQGAVQEVPRAMAGDGAAQINMLYTFVSAMDPQSAVREGEIGLAQSATPFWTSARAMLDKYTSGQSVTVPPAMIQKMGELLKRRYTGYQKQVKERADYYGQRGQRWGIQPDVFATLPDLPADAPQSPGNPLRPLKTR